MRRIRVVIADRHPIVLQGISSVLATQHDFAIVAACGDTASCIGAIRLLVPDIALVDIAMPSISRPDILAIANTAGQGTRVIFFAEKAGDQRLQTLAAGRACLVLTRDAEPEMLVATLRKVAERQGPASRSPCTGGEVRGASHTGEEKAPTQLTDRERQIMRLVSEGLSNKEIGRFLSITDVRSKSTFTTSSRSSISAIEQFSRHLQFRKTGNMRPHVNSPLPAYYSRIRRFETTRTSSEAMSFRNVRVSWTSHHAGR